MTKKEADSSTLSVIPNFLTIIRLVAAFATITLIAFDASLYLIVVVFSLGAYTDWVDGRIARKHHWVSEFGRKADMIADRFLWTGTALAFVVIFGVRGELNWLHYTQFGIMMAREIISAPFAIYALAAGRAIPHARYVAKATTFFQGFAFPAVMLSVIYPVFMWISIPLAIATLITGTQSGLWYIYDLTHEKEVEAQWQKDNKVKAKKKGKR